MIITKVLSGLGNQMFQYAAGKSLAIFHGTELKIDNSWFYDNTEKQTPRSYGLGIFNLDEKIATQAEIAHFTGEGNNSLLARIINRYYRALPVYKRPVYEEPHFHFDAHFFNTRKAVLISGYWQSEKYFMAVSDEIRKNFSIAVSGNENLSLERSIKATNAVSLHIRRGDMVNNPDVAKTHGSCDMAYYMEAIERISSSLEHPEFFIFSDDPQWCQENLNIKFPSHIVSHNQGENAWQDMQLMRMCKHQIIANSSFSWWGAWLNPNPQKLVIAPKRWFNQLNHDIRDLIPPGWEQI